MSFIPYSDFQSEDSGFSRLFINYVENYSLVNSLFPGNFRESGDWQDAIKRVLQHKRDRSKLVQILSNQNRDFHCGVQTLANIDSLINDNTMAVITGQQVGLFGGPLYTIYKSLTAIKLAEKFSREYPEYNFVPVFWLESEDHDYEEVSTITVFNSGNEVTKFDYTFDPKNTTRNFGPIGKVPLNDTIEQLFQQLQSTLLPTEYSTKVLDLFRSAYMPGMTFSKAFVHLMNVLMENSGLIFFDPHDKDAKQLLKPIFQRELSHISESCKLVISQSELIEQQYHAQVKPRSINLFLHHQGGRYAIEPRTEGFSLKGIRQNFSTSELLGMLEDSPESFSPNVVLRPICQDWLFPTISYVAGPSEIAYFAQFKPLYPYFDLPQPILYPRASLTILEERINKIIQKYDLRLNDFYQEKELIKQRIAEQLSDFKVDTLFSNTAGTIEESLNSLKDGLQTIDATLVPALEHSLSKITGNLQVLKEKTIAAQKRQHETALRQIDRVADSIYPFSTLQERKINLIYFLNKYGLEFLRWLYNEVEIDKFKHQVITIE